MMMVLMITVTRCSGWQLLFIRERLKENLASSDMWAEWDNKRLMKTFVFGITEGSNEPENLGRSG